MTHEGDEYYCPNCGAILDNQIGFDPDLGAWECTECGQTLFGDEVESTQVYFNDVIWRCDNCDAVLNIQTGFIDCLGCWICTECGYENEISEDNIINSPSLPESKLLRRIDRFAHFLNWISGGPIHDDSSLNDYEKSVDSDSNSDVDSAHSPNGSVSITTEDVETKPRWQDFVMQPPANTIIRPSVGKQIWYHVIRKKLQAKQSSAELMGTPITVAYAELAAWGLYNIEAIAEEDLEITDVEAEGTVSNIIINGYSSFETNSFFPFNATTIIRYHSLKTIQPPFTSRQAKGKYYQDILEEFLGAGFCNVKPIPIFDLTFGWMIKDGAVESVQIEGKRDFSINENYRLDVNIVISYHTFKNFKKRGR